MAELCVDCGTRKTAEDPATGFRELRCQICGRDARQRERFRGALRLMLDAMRRADAPVKARDLAEPVGEACHAWRLVGLLHLLVRSGEVERVNKWRWRLKPIGAEPQTDQNA